MTVMLCDLVIDHILPPLSKVQVVEGTLNDLENSTVSRTRLALEASEGLWVVSHPALHDPNLEKGGYM